MTLLSRSAAGKLSETQIKEICRLKNKAWPHSISSQIKWWRKNTKKKDICLILQVNKKVIGFMRLRHRKVRLGALTKKAICVTEVCIHPKWRKKGKGTLLMEKATEIIKNDPSKFGYLICKKNFYFFYKTCGWNKIIQKVFIIKKNKKRKTLDCDTVCMTVSPPSSYSRQINLYGNTF